MHTTLNTRVAGALAMRGWQVFLMIMLLASGSLLLTGTAAAGDAVTGHNVTHVVFGRDGNKLGKYKQTGPGQWKEVPAKKRGNTFQFRETSRDDWSVYLEDGSRNVRIQLDLHRKKVRYGDSSSPDMRDLYDILRAKAKKVKGGGGGSVGTAAPPPAKPPQLFKETRVPTRAPVVINANGRNVTQADFGRDGDRHGQYRQTGPDQWQEISTKAGGSTFTFSETSRDDWSVYLKDDSRNVRIQLDLHRKKVRYGDSRSPNMQDLYDVLGAEAGHVPTPPVSAAPPPRPVSQPPTPYSAPPQPRTQAAVQPSRPRPVSPPRPASKAEFDSATRFDAAKLCSRGSFFDLNNGGECWSCPPGFNRTVFDKVTSGRACERPGGETLRSANRGDRGTGFLGTDCPSGQKWDPNGWCYSCPPGFNRTLNPVTSNQACSQAVRAQYASAHLEGPFLCPRGQFFDLSSGACWSCPNGWYRTVNRIDGVKACTNRPEMIFAADPKEFCRSTLKALRDGRQGAEQLSKSINDIIEPLLQPINDALAEANSKMQSPRELDQMLADAASALDGEGLRTITQINSNLSRQQRPLLDLLLDQRLMCDGSPVQIETAVRRLGIRPADARAAPGGRLYDVYTIGLTIATGKGLNVDVAMALATDLAGSGGVFLNLSPSAGNAAMGVSLNLDAELVSQPSIHNFSSVLPGIELSLGANGEVFDKMFSKIKNPGVAGGAAAGMPDSLTIAWESENLVRIANGQPVSAPSFSVKQAIDLGGGGGKAKPPKFEVSAGASWFLPMDTWGR